MLSKPNNIDNTRLERPVFFENVRLFRKKFRAYSKVRTVFSLLPSKQLKGLKL